LGILFSEAKNVRKNASRLASFCEINEITHSDRSFVSPTYEGYILGGMGWL
jgi:hypothetical protein